MSNFKACYNDNILKSETNCSCRTEIFFSQNLFAKLYQRCPHLETTDTDDFNFIDTFAVYLIQMSQYLIKIPSFLIICFVYFLFIFCSHN